MSIQFDLTLQEAHWTLLKQLLHREDGQEAAAYVLYGEAHIHSDPWDRQQRRRLTSYEVVPIPEEEQISASDVHVTWSTASFVKLLKRAQADKLILGIVHSHPHGFAEFSEQDDQNEQLLLQLAQNRNGNDTPLVSLLFAGETQVCARLWIDKGFSVTASVVRVVGKHLASHWRDELSNVSEIFDRQSLAFGRGLTQQLQKLKVGVVGCGGTGSATAMLLARLGVGQVLLIDEDRVEATNLNRLHGAKRSDADAMRAKVHVLAREITEMSIGTRVFAMQSWVGATECQEALKACDVIFGCTDDHDGRLLLNRFAYFYLTSVIDMGLAIAPNPLGGFRDMSGRVTVLAPGSSCLLCRGIIDPIIAREESLKRTHPEQYERQKREAYIRGGDNPAPAVVTFTTSLACMAIDELIQGMTGFRDDDGWLWNHTRRYDRLEDRRPGATHNQDCPVCAESLYLGRADVMPFLDRTG